MYSQLHKTYQEKSKNKRGANYTNLENRILYINARLELHISREKQSVAIQRKKEKYKYTLEPILILGWAFSPD